MFIGTTSRKIVLTPMVRSGEKDGKNYLPQQRQVKSGLSDLRSEIRF
jgi:hypothetical protein